MTTSRFYKVILITLKKTFTNHFLQDLPHLWLVIEDSHTNVYGILKYFHDYMQTGDYFIVENLNPDLPVDFGYDRIFPCTYKRAGDAGLKKLKAFLTEYSHTRLIPSIRIFLDTMVHGIGMALFVKWNNNNA